MVEKFMVENFMVEISRVERFMVEKSGVEKSGVEMSFNPLCLLLKLRYSGIPKSKPYHRYLQQRKIVFHKHIGKD